MKLTWICMIGLAAMLAWVNLAVSQERPKHRRPEAPGGRQGPAGSPVRRGRPRAKPPGPLPAREGRGPAAAGRLDSRRGLVGGSKEGCPAVPLTAKGYAVASINYRLSQHAVFPAQIEDCKAAIRWLRANAAKYHLDPDHIGVWGASAGGHLVAMLGTTGSVKELEGTGREPRPVQPRAVRRRLVRPLGPGDDGGSHDKPGSPEVPSHRRPRPGEQGEGPQGQPADLRQQGLRPVPHHARRPGQPRPLGKAKCWPRP